MSSNGNYKYDSKAGEVLVRRATKDDIAALIDISRMSFPHYPDWCTKRQAQKWWQSIIESPFCETWICEYAGEVVGLTRLVTDPDQHRKERNGLRPSLGTLLYFFVTHPRVLIANLARRIHTLHQADERYLDANNLEAFAGKAVWSHSIAVLPKMRNKGLGTTILKFCECRTLQLGYDSIRAFIEQDNQAIIRLVEKLGFIRTGKMGTQYGYVKALSRKA